MEGEMLYRCLERKKRETTAAQRAGRGRLKSAKLMLLFLIDQVRNEGSERRHSSQRCMKLPYNAANPGWISDTPEDPL